MDNLYQLHTGRGGYQVLLFLADIVSLEQRLDDGCTGRWTTEVLSDDADAETLVGVIVKSAGSGTIGDGKVWVAPLDSVTRVRTGETGSAAI